MYQRTITEWERQRNRLEMEHGELMSRVNYLSDEVCSFWGGNILTHDTDLMSPADCAGEATWNSTALSLACGSSIHGPYTGIPGRGFA
jgi:hypothetical protein